MDAKTLIDEAAEKCGGYAELGRRTGIHPVSLSRMKSGTQPISPETVALVADVLELPGEEVQKLVAWTIIEAAKNTSKRERLKRAFFGCWVAGAVAATLSSSPTQSNAAGIDFEGYARVNPIYIVAHLLRLIVTFARMPEQLTRGAHRRLRSGFARPLHPGAIGAA